MSDDGLGKEVGRAAEIRALPIDVPGPSLAQTDVGDNLAEREFSQFSRLDDLEDRKKRNKVAVHAVLGWMIPITVILIFSGFWSLVGVYLWHLVNPGMGWLNKEQLKELHTLLFSGAVGAVGAIASQGVKRYLD